ncbi:hypothetical protein AB0G73_10685 [Streptomyces sp. NPDC020719]|uniref:hypothetical protein n=1 Tax=Streptomyces sp. NPDC020719 TaxID=3154896 RepID=UPI0033DBAE00
MAPVDPYMRAALEAGRHEESKQIAMIDGLHLSATALLGFEGAAVALMDTENWWNTFSIYFLFVSIFALILNLLGVYVLPLLLMILRKFTGKNATKSWRREKVSGITPELLDKWLHWSPDTLEDHLFVAYTEAMRTNETVQIKERQRRLAVAVGALAAALICRGFGAISG